MSSQYGELRPTSGWGLLASLGHPGKFQRVSPLGSVTARFSSSGRQPNFAALNRARHIYSAGRPSRWALAHILVFSCFIFFFFFSLNLSGRRLDVYHTSTHGVALMRIFWMQVWNVLHAARWKCRTQKSPKIRHLRTIAQLCPTMSSQPRHVSTIGKKAFKQQYLAHMPPQYGKVWPTNGWDLLASLGHPR